MLKKKVQTEKVSQKFSQVNKNMMTKSKKMLDIWKEKKKKSTFHSMNIIFQGKISQVDNALFKKRKKKRNSNIVTYINYMIFFF